MLREVEDEATSTEGLVAGTDVGGYIVDRELGRGGMGVVYAATHPVIGKRAAIKVIKPSLSNHPATVERFVQEARSVNQIGHPGIVDIFAFGRLPDGRSYLVMDLLEGESLRKRLKRGALHVSEAAMILLEVASALAAAHDKGFIHRDLKPDNIFLVAHPGRTDVKLLDFGLAKLLGASGLAGRAYRTATGAQVGTPDYMSPEQLRGAADLDGRSDIYSLGVVAFEMLTGRRLRRGLDGKFSDLTETVAQAVGAKPFVPADLAQLVEHMMAQDPGTRPSLAAIRATIKRVRPSLPSMSVVGLEVSLPPMPMGEPESIDMSASQLGARPMLPTPVGGAPVAPPPAAPAPAPTALRPANVAHPSTTVGVPPPPAAPRSARISAAPVPRAAPRRESRLWLVVGLVLVVGAVVALAIVYGG